MTVFRRGSRYWYEFHYLGARIRESAKTSNREIAERAERARRLDLERGANGLEKKERPTTFDRVAKDWLAGNPHWTESTREIATLKVSRLIPFFGKMFIADIDAKDIATYQRQRQREKAAPRTINMEVSALRQILREQGRWAFIEGKVKMLREHDEIGRALTADELQRIEAVANKSRSRSLPVAIRLLRHTGMRVSELRTMRWRQVELSRSDCDGGPGQDEGQRGTAHSSE